MEWYDDSTEQTQGTLNFPRWAAAAAAAVLITVGLLLTSGGQAFAAETWDNLRETIAGIGFQRQDVSPGAGQEATIAPTRYTSAADAQAEYGFALPADATLTTIQGYDDENNLLGEGEAMITDFGESGNAISLRYIAGGGTDLWVFIQTNDKVGRTLGPNVSIEEVEVNGQPAALYPTGAYREGVYVTSNESLTLMWRADGFNYEIRGAFSAEELITIAESFE